MIPKQIEQGEGRRKLAFPLFVLGLCLLAWAPSCGEAPPPLPAEIQGEQALRLQGSTMGTTWSTSLHGADPGVDWQAVIQAELDEIEGALTTWDPKSDLMRFNAAEKDYEVEHELTWRCMELAQRAARATNSAFDPTIQPLVTLWGFGVNRDVPMPTEEQIQSALARTGAKHYSRAYYMGHGGPEAAAKHGSPLRKGINGLQVDLSAIAKGFAADELVSRIFQEECAGGLIEVGGEIRVFGERSDGGPWRIGVESPAEHPGAAKVIGTVLAIDASWNLKAVATSGDSRNRRTIGDYTFSHIIDPRTGWPLDDPPASVTVVAPDCATADAWATALMVLGPEEGLPLAEEAGLEVCFQLRTEDGSYREVATEGYEPLVAERLNR